MATQSAISSQEDLASLAEQVDRAMGDVKALDEIPRNKAAALKSAIEEFHRLGLLRIVRLLKSDPRGKELLFELVDDPAVYALFSMHGLVRDDTRVRVSRVVEMVRPYLKSHGGDVSLVDVRDDTVFVRLSGACDGCSMSSITLRETVEATLRDRVPEIRHVEVASGYEGGFVPLHTLTDHGLNRDEVGWIKGPALSEITKDTPTVIDADGTPVLIMQLGEQFRAFRNACAHQGLPLDGGVFDADSETITCPWHGWCYNATTGECLTSPQAQLEQYPLRIEGGHLWIRPQ